MSIPDWYELVLLSLAAWRVFQLLSDDDISNWLRRYVTGQRGESKFVPEQREWLADFIECPYCFGFWIGLGWWGAFQVWEHGTIVAAVPFAISAGVVAGAKVLSPT